jgi:hypothetical protein
MRVHVATQISQIFVLEQQDAEIYGNPVRGQVACLQSDDCINLFLTEECATAECPPFDLVRLFADICAIQDPSHYSLLFVVLSNYSMESIAATFARQGLQAEGTTIGMIRNSRDISIRLI